MQPAMVITRGGGTTRFTRSNDLAARVMQDVVKETRAGQVDAPRSPPPQNQRNENREPRTRLGAQALREDVATVRTLVAALRDFKMESPADAPVLIRADVIEHGLFAAEVLPDVDADYYDPGITALDSALLPAPMPDEAPDSARSEKSPRALKVGQARLDLVWIEPGIEISQSAGSHFSVLLPDATRQDLRFERFGEEASDLDVMLHGEKLISFAKVDYTASLTMVLRDTRIVLNTDAPDAAARVMDVSV